jgi:hypothetical protein
MEYDYNQYDTACNENVFTIRGHSVTLISPTVAKIQIYCPFPLPSGNPTKEQNSFVMNQTQSVVNYMISENFISRSDGLSVMVSTVHAKK